MRRWICAALATGWCGLSQAVVNIEDIRPGEPQEGYSGNAKLAIGGESGNTDKLAIDAGGRLQWHREHITNFAILNYTYGESRGVRDTNKSFLHLRHIREVGPTRAYEAFTQLETDEFARLSLRTLIGGGARFTLQQDPGVVSTHIGLGLFYSVEELDEQPGLTDDGRSDLWRVNLYLSHKRRLNDQMQFVSTTYYQPAIGEPGDYRLLEQAALNIKMTEGLVFKIGLDIAHDNRPPQTVQKTDTSYSTGIEYQF